MPELNERTQDLIFQGRLACTQALAAVIGKLRVAKIQIDNAREAVFAFTSDESRALNDVLQQYAQEGGTKGTALYDTWIDATKGVVVPASLQEVSSALDKACTECWGAFDEIIDEAEFHRLIGVEAGQEDNLKEWLDNLLVSDRIEELAEEASTYLNKFMSGTQRFVDDEVVEVALSVANDDVPNELIEEIRKESAHYADAFWALEEKLRPFGGHYSALENSLMAETRSCDNALRGTALSLEETRDVLRERAGIPTK